MNWKIIYRQKQLTTFKLMGWLIFIAGIVGFIIYNFMRDKDQMLKHQVDMRGGMAKKYEFLI